MPHLNWREADQGSDALAASVETFATSGAHSGPRSAFTGKEYELTLRMSVARRDALLHALREVLAEGAIQGMELRLDLPREWIVFWKLREGGSRLLMAHPSEHQWVAAIGLEPAHARRFLGALASCAPGKSVELGALGPAGEVTNAEIRIQVV